MNRVEVGVDIDNVFIVASVDREDKNCLCITEVLEDGEPGDVYAHVVSFVNVETALTVAEVILKGLGVPETETLEWETFKHIGDVGSPYIPDVVDRPNMLRYRSPILKIPTDD